jgi:hypothetical protein
MVGKQELITLKGKLKMAVASDKSRHGDDFFKVPLEFNKTDQNGEKIENEFDSVMLIF